MPTNPMISLKAQVPNVGASISNALTNVSDFDRIKSDRELQPLRNRLLDAKTQSAELGLTEDQERAEINAMRIRSIGGQNALATQGREGLISFFQNEINAGPTLEGGRGMIDSQDFLDLIQNNPNISDEDLMSRMQGFEQAANRMLGSPVGQKAATVQSSRQLPGGLVQLTMSDGTIKTVEPSEADAELIKSAENRGVELSGQKAGERGRQGVIGKEQGKTETQDERNKNIRADVRAEDEAGISVKAADELAEKIIIHDESIALTEKMIQALDDGAVTGDLARFTPTIQQASKELKHLQSLAGLNVLQTTTFGALSESELKFALDTALPTNMDSDELKEYLQTKLEGQRKLKALHSKLNRMYNEGLTPSQAIIRLEDENKKMKRLEELREKAARGNS